ncbi:nucleotide-binding domain-containing protein [Thozetella sp. PMI_491]|nr:nucleotide-binding domain-containing protein [Thozetella sp. PMI_491]
MLVVNASDFGPLSVNETPPNKDVADLRSNQLPGDVGIVIIGSGMTGLSAARHLLKSPPAKGPLRIAMVEARQACSGTTGSNGGQITTASFAEYNSTKALLGREEALKVIHLPASSAAAMMEAAGELNPEGCDAAEATMFPRTVGGFVGSPEISGALWPYRFVMHMLKELLDVYPNFSLDTNTSVTNISTVQDHSPLANNSSLPTFVVNTERGAIRTRHVIHAENAWIPHLVPGLQGKLTGGRLHMSAQLAGASIPKAQDWAPIWPRNDPTKAVYRTLNTDSDYIVQLPKNGEFMMGGGGGGDSSKVAWYDESSPPDLGISAYLDGAMASYFGGENYGAERTDFPQPDDPNVWKGRTKRVWTGVKANSPDGRPLVGRLPTAVTTRPVPLNARGAEWISTGYDGQGMCWAYLCARALSSSILSFENSPGNGTDAYPDWFPWSLVASEARLAGASAGSNRTRLAR